MFVRHYRPKNGQDVKVLLSASTPVSHHKDSEWQVALKSTGLEPPFAQTVYGVDAIQALELALMTLRTIEQKEGLKLPDS